MPEFGGLASALGRSVPARRGGEATDRLRPTLPQNAAPRSLSATYGLAAFPFHTDGAHHRVPPRFVLMRLADGAASGTPTLLVDGYRSLIHAVDRKMLARETWLVRGGFGRTFYAPILDTARGLLRFDPGCMRHPAGTAPKGGGILMRRLEQAPLTRIDWTQDATLVVDNWRMLHARGAVAPSDTGRCLIRTLVG